MNARIQLTNGGVNNCMASHRLLPSIRAAICDMILSLKSVTCMYAPTDALATWPATMPGKQRYPGPAEARTATQVAHALLFLPGVNDKADRAVHV